MKKLIALLLLLAACAPLPTTPIPVTAIPPVTVTPGPVITVTPVSQDAPFLPNPAWQPGAFNPAVTQATIQTTICVSGYSSSIRPPLSYTEPIKLAEIKQYGYADANPADFELDHLIAIEDGGDPRAITNLWPQPRNTQPWNAGKKDGLENVLHTMICNESLPLDTARQALATDWVAAYKRYIGSSLIAITPVPPEP